MAERRMFAKTIIDSDAFIDMPVSARLLYYDLSMRADDDGFVNSPKKIMRMVGATDDDMRILIAKKFVIDFDSGVIVIKHWRIHNYIRKDTYNETNYKDEKSLLELDENKAYRMVGNNLDTKCIQSVDGTLTQVRLGKDRLGNNTISKDIVSGTKTTLQDIVDEWNTLSVYGIKPISKLTQGTKRYDCLNARLKQYTVDEVFKAIGKIRSSDFLQGKNFKGWVITFDWFVLPNNFIKVLEGNYDNRETTVGVQKQDRISNTIEELRGMVND